MSVKGSNIIVRHTEYIGDVSAQASVFSVTPYSVNPGLNVTFPWLSNIANNYESYKFHKLHFVYKPICSTTTPGKVILAMDYDAADVTPTSKVVINSFESTTSCSPWDEITHISMQSNLLKFGVQRYVRSAGVPANTDVKTYDVGKFYVATSNTPSTPTTLGELYVSYEVELITPQLSNFVPAQFNNEPVGSPFWMQFARIAVNAAGVATLFSEYYNQLMFIIAQQQTVGGRAIVDIALNPNINKLVKFDYSCNQAATIGRPAGTPPPAFGGLQFCQSSGPFSLSIAQGSGGINSSWVTEPSPGMLETEVTLPNNALPVYRLSLPANSTSFLNAYTLQGAPNMQFETLPTISGLTPLERNEFVFNWAQQVLPSSLSAYNEVVKATQPRIVKLE